MNWLFGTDGFPPRWRCGTGWEAEPWVGWLHVVGDSLIAAAYTSIPLLLIYLGSKRNDVPFHWLGGLFAAFILACGATHALDAFIFWEPLYRLSGLMKALTAAVSWATVAALLLALPAILHLPGRAKLADSLEAEIAERRRAEAAERTAREAAEAANVAKTQFLAAMSHELRTPLTAVLGYADLLARALENPDRRDMARQIRANGNHLLTLLNDLLDLSKVEAGKLEIDRRPVELVPLLEEVRSLMNVQALDRGLKLEVRYLGPVPRFVMTDAVRLRQCLLNLLSNAIKFTDRGRVRMEVRFLPDAPADLTADARVPAAAGAI
ncbi:sensor histidine kinase [Alienimonas californiensis]|uniref:histidine kinase n=1 Tax=Alienimonas californiensis TaxID=2527989 RepID=A0A517PFP5_9PLAN|nr:histidine kinase dimerization/phospho-acceptor domain-containing protein [Alienimonas californiensis]QDT18217.1 Sensor protein TorS [Alienimonas californiensis]